MEEKLSTEATPNTTRKRTAIVGILLLLLLSLAFAAGFVLGREDNPAPIIIKTGSQ